ncbi:hypothetical protein [Undibacterium sp. Xuan67W]|uniref:hypothetical protein n=1 Tax=Undibacterium sp. Xuan67W TaxID=3413057 RepID=UPI003BF45638
MFFAILYGSVFENYVRDPIQRLAITYSDFFWQLCFYIGFSPLLILLALAANAFFETVVDEPFKFGEGNTKAQNLIALWRGEKTLLEAFWKYHVPYLFFSLFLGSFAFTRWLTMSLLEKAILGCILFIESLVFLTLSSVGSWRSAANYRGSNKFQSLGRFGIVSSDMLLWYLIAKLAIIM